MLVYESSTHLWPHVTVVGSKHLPWCGLCPNGKGETGDSKSQCAPSEASVDSKNDVIKTLLSSG